MEITEGQLRVVKMARDHSCLFHCLEYARSGRINKGHKLRTELVGWMRTHGNTQMGGLTLNEWVRSMPSSNDKRGMSLDAYCNRMLNPNEWGDVYIIRAFSFMEAYSIYLYEHGVEGIQKKAMGGDFEVPVEKGRAMLLYDGNHYDALVTHEQRSMIPSLTDISRINDGFKCMYIRVEEVSGKGLGLIAQRGIPSGVLVAYGLLKLYQTKRIRPSPYLIDSGIPGYTCGLFDGSFPSPGEDRVPYIAPLVNEADDANCMLQYVKHSSRSHRKYALLTTRPVRMGEEICWDYGPDFGERSYPSKYNGK